MTTPKIRPATRPPSAADATRDDKSRATVTRRDLALAVFERCEGLSRRESKRLVDSVIDEMVDVLTQGETLKLHDFGSFVVRDKRERSGRNPRTGAKVPIAERRVVVFKASPNMKDAVNAGAPPTKERKRVRTADAGATDEDA